MNTVHLVIIVGGVFVTTDRVCAAIERVFEVKRGTKFEKKAKTIDYEG